MRVAILHDYLDQRGGAERVVLSMLKAFPDAALYTSLFMPERTWSGFDAYDVRTICTPREHAVARRTGSRAIAPLIARRWRRFRATDDIETIVASSSGFAHWSALSNAAPTGWYCYTPPRWLYKPDQYFQGRPGGRFLSGALDKVWRPIDQQSAAATVAIAGISRAICDEITTIYHRPASLLPPPVSGSGIRVSGSREAFLLCVGRLVPYKNFDVAIRAAARLDMPLKIVGTGPMDEAWRKLARDIGADVAFLGYVPDDALGSLYARAAALLQPGAEDFGLTPIEAGIEGCPSVCLARAGALDTVIDGVTGRLVQSLDPDEWAAIVPDVLGDGMRNAVVEHADQFREERWIPRFQDWVTRIAG